MIGKAFIRIAFIAAVIACAGCTHLIPDLSNEDITVDHDVVEEDAAVDVDMVRPDVHDDTHDNPDAAVDAVDVVDATDIMEDISDVMADDVGEEEYECLLPEHCTDGDICNGDETCDPETHTCVEGLLRDDGFLCGEAPRKICLDHECTESICGDGFVDEGGGEFCEPPGVGGCDDECKLGCDGPEDCPDDGDACNGEEYCNMTSHTCARRSVPADGTSCGGGNVCCGGECLECCNGLHCIDSNPCTRDVCTLGVCSNPAEDDGTDCPGGNMCCTGVCRECCGNGDCDDTNPCTYNRCTSGSCTYPPMPLRTDCGGGNVCCSGTCRECCDATDCNDSNVCTQDICSGAGICSNPAATDSTPCGGGNVCCAGVCKGCCVDADCNDDNDCSWDRCNSSKVCRNSDKDDMTACDGGDGVCCNGDCKEGGECCADSHCSPRCRGTARSCNSIGSSGSCNAQDGCTWDPAGPCSGAGVDCEVLGGAHCDVCGCVWESNPDPPPLGMCEGDHVVCTDVEESWCDMLCGCSWDAAGPCSGTAAACASFTTQSPCNSQDDCSWVSCTGYTCG